MKQFRKEELLSARNAAPGAVYRENVLTNADAASDLAGLIVIIPPGVEGQAHFHRKRESVQIFLSGDAVGRFGDKESPIAEGDVIFIPAGEKHCISNRTDREVRFIEFFTEPPLEADIVPVG
jgi:mannose-6-phosphate isomerase-like protein (cupin superfamily)